MGMLLDALAQKKLLVSDGAWGTMLQEAGMTANDCPEAWNLSHPDVVRGIAQAYGEAGSDIVLTNTFGGSTVKLAKMGYDAQVAEINEAGIRLSMKGAPNAIIMGSVGPSGEFLMPLGDMDEETLESAFTDQIRAMLNAGVHAICIETMMDLQEALCAIRAARRLDPNLDIVSTFTFNAAGDSYRTMMGNSPAELAAAVAEAGANVVGSNCGNGIEQMIPVTREFRDATDLPILIHANAGLPEMVGSKAVYNQGPEVMAGYVQALVEAGAQIIGGCCGTTPYHIRAIKAIVDSIRGQ